METEEDRSSFLATTVHIPEGLEASTSDRDAAQAVAAGLRDAKAPNTRRAYASAWHMFFEWTILTGRPAMPSDPQTVALYLGHLAADGKTIATISQARAAISHAHAAEGISQTDNVARHPVVAETMKGWRNQAPAPQQAKALTAEALAWIRETARLPRRGRGGRMDVSSRGTGPGHRRPGNHRSDERRRTEALRSRGTDVGRRRLLGRRISPHHDPEGQEPIWTPDRGGHRDHRPRPAGH